MRAGRLREWSEGKLRLYFSILTFSLLESVKRVDDAISILQSLARGAFMAKTDLKSAFRLIPIHPDDWNLLGIYWQS